MRPDPCSCLALLGLLLVPVAAAAAEPAKLPVGMNLAGINDYQAGYPFRNLMWGARPWLTKNADGCDLFVAFSGIREQGSRYGSWGHLEHYGQDPAQMSKFQALLDANAVRK